MFWIPSPRPLQYGPAISAMAVKAKPLSATLITDAATSNGTAIHQPSQPVIASAAMLTTAR